MCSDNIYYLNEGQDCAGQATEPKIKSTDLRGIFQEFKSSK